MVQYKLPGTVIDIEDTDGTFTIFRAMVKTAGGLTLSQICTITGLEPAAIQNWIKRGFVPHPENKRYFERQLARILMISALRDSMKIERIGELMRLINGDTDDTSDDIVSEEELYDIFSKAVIEVCAAHITKGDISKYVEGVVSGYKDEPLARERLTKALEVMTYAYMSVEMKKQAEACFDELLELKERII